MSTQRCTVVRVMIQTIVVTAVIALLAVGLSSARKLRVPETKHWSAITEMEYLEAELMARDPTDPSSIIEYIAAVDRLSPEEAFSVHAKLRRPVDAEAAATDSCGRPLWPQRDRARVLGSVLEANSAGADRRVASPIYGYGYQGSNEPWPAVGSDREQSRFFYDAALREAQQRTFVDLRRAALPVPAKLVEEMRQETRAFFELHSGLKTSTIPQSEQEEARTRALESGH